MADDGEHHYSGDNEEEEYSDDEMAIEPYQSEEFFRPTLADDQKAGFFSQDRCTQTETTEVIDLKEMTEVIEQLLEDVDTMKRDINFAKSVLQADFELKLQQKSLDLYQRVNEKISQIERMHADRVDTIRRAFKQQLADALARMATYYTKNFDQKLKREQTKKNLDRGKMEEKYAEMQATVQRNESVITMLEMQIEQLRKQLEENEVASVRTKTPSINFEAEELRDEIAVLHRKIKRLEDALAVKEENANLLAKDMEALQDELDRERIMVEQLKQEKEDAALQAEKKQSAAMAKVENQRLNMEQQMSEQIRRVKQEALEQARKEAKEMQETERERYRQLQEEKKMVEELLAKERAKAAEKSQDALDLEKAHRLEERLKGEVSRLKKEIEKIHKTWEKKFAILQQSLHALKDESFLRQTLQRQAAQLHQASISYANDTPLGIMPSQRSGGPSQHASPMGKKPLPNISRSAKNQGGPPDYISYTVSAPSGRGTTVLSIDENQIMSDNDQDFPGDVMPLPSPPRATRVKFSQIKAAPGLC